MTGKRAEATMHSGELTFVVPAYGESSHLEHCLQSLSRQTSGARIILTTSTPSAFLTSLASRFGYPLIVNPRKAGIASDWSFAYSNAGTRYVTLAHQDDVYAPDYAARCVAAADRHPDSLVVFTDAAELLDGRSRLQSRTLTVKRTIVWLFFARSEAIRSLRMKQRLISLGNPISCPTVLYNRANIGDFTFSEGWSYNLDWDAWQRLAELDGSFVYVKQPLVSHRIHEESALVRGTTDNSRGIEDRRMFRRFWPKPVALLLAGLYAMSYDVSRASTP